ncbi:PIN domain-containing protein [Sphingobium sp. YR768]|uniref:PIN domain-containing protein n=1 Tax=Sphingobium sp. YR768 TaxID=1884365 RepID=UPI0008C89D7B|nr:PIN domain-containing protein [Sphingobium sp. YR768]SER00371.1 Predicted nucleic acid-binding protein, contains PIN domain [Sphingobium sp. YR768]
MPGSFLDSNVILYMAGADRAKAERAEALLADGGLISVQVLNEITSVARRKMGLDWPETHALLSAVRGLVDVVPVTIDIHEAGIAIAERYQLSVYDGMIVAAARAAGCATLWSEDMQHGLLVDGALRILNPFLREG